MLPRHRRRTIPCPFCFVCWVIPDPRARCQAGTKAPEASLAADGLPGSEVSKERPRGISGSGRIFKSIFGPSPKGRRKDQMINQDDDRVRRHLCSEAPVSVTRALP